MGREYSDTARQADLILSLPETAEDAAYGLHEQTGLRWERCIRRHRYVTERAFILLEEDRQAAIDRKINILGPKVRGKKVLVVDDSVVRSDTTKVTVGKLKGYGAEKIYLFITFPKIIGPCFYGIDMATYSELIAARHETEGEIALEIDPDGRTEIHYQPIPDFVKATGMKEDELCLACVTGKYPTPKAQKLADERRERFEKGEEDTKRRAYE